MPAGVKRFLNRMFAANVRLADYTSTRSGIELRFDSRFPSFDFWNTINTPTVVETGMTKLLLVWILLSSITALTYATNQTAICPQDGETASFTGNRSADKDDHSRDMCEYSHEHYVRALTRTYVEKHTFWQNCGDSRSGSPEQKPNLSGTWIFNPRKSSLQVPPPSSQIFVIQHTEPHFRLTRTLVLNGKSNTWSIDILTDGKQEVVEHVGADTASTRAFWEGSSLVLEMTVSYQNGEKASNLVKYSLADDGKTFIALEYFTDPNGEHVNKWVFNKENP